MTAAELKAQTAAPSKVNIKQEEKRGIAVGVGVVEDGQFVDRASRVYTTADDWSIDVDGVATNASRFQ